MSDIVIGTLHVIYRGIFKVEGDRYPCLAFSKYSIRSFGESRNLTSSVEISDPDHLARLERDFKPGDAINLVLENDRNALSSKLLDFTHPTPEKEVA